jgi:hypothetical protein
VTLTARKSPVLLIDVFPRLKGAEMVKNHPLSRHNERIYMETRLGRMVEPRGFEPLTS